jgi:DNA-binding transcriptional regulator YiaG
MFLRPDEIRALRVSLQLTQIEFAERVGVSERTVQGWELGETTPQPRHRRALSDLATKAAA